jgi:hypothetical protein
MDARITPIRTVLGAAALFCLVAVPVAVGSADSGGPQATASASIEKQVKKLKRQLKKLKQQVQEDQETPGPQGPQGPPGIQGPPGPSTGVAGGDLTGSYPNPSIATGAVNSAKVSDDSLTPADIADIAFLRAETANLNDQPGGAAGESQALFTIGRVELNASCQDAGGGSLRGMITPAVDEAGPVLVTDGEAGNADDDVRLQPFDVQFVVILTSSTLAAQEKSFAILDNGGTSASGVAAVSVDPATGDCVITAHAVG